MVLDTGTGPQHRDVRDAVFEEFVTVALTEALAVHGGRCVAQDTRHRLDHEHRIELRPDLVRYGRDGRPQAVVDAKYKSEKPAGYPYADLYQLLAYCTALDVPVGHLVYAEGKPAEVRIRNTDVLIRQHALDLTTPVAALMNRIRELAAHVNSGDGR